MSSCNLFFYHHKKLYIVNYTHTMFFVNKPIGAAPRKQCFATAEAVLS